MQPGIERDRRAARATSPPSNKPSPTTVSPAQGGALNFADVQQTRQRLQAAGFGDLQVDLHHDPAHLQPGEQLETFLANVLLGALLDRIPPADHHQIVEDIAVRLPAPAIDYVRLRTRALRQWTATNRATGEHRD